MIIFRAVLVYDVELLGSILSTHRHTHEVMLDDGGLQDAVPISDTWFLHQRFSGPF